MRFPHFSKVLAARGLALLTFSGIAFLATTGIAHADVGEDILQGILSGVGKLFAAILLLVTSLWAIVLGWMASFFNFAMTVTVFRFADFFGNTEGLRIAWGLLRDLANIILLFGFIFIGVMTILDIGNFTAKKALPTLIIFAVLLNFSLFVSEALVDGANALASSFYAQIGGTDCSYGADDEECFNQGLARHVLEASGISGAFNIGSEQWAEILDFEEDGVRQASVWFGVFVFVIVLIGVFFVGGVMLISRAVTLVILFVTSPIGFAGMAIPPLHKYAEMWWQKLLDNVIFAPIFVLLLLISLKLIQGIRHTFLGGNEQESLIVALTESDVGIGGIFVLFGIVIAFIWLALDTAKNFSIAGADQVVGGTKKWIGGTVGAFSTQPVGFAARKIGEGYDRSMRAIRRTPGLQTLSNVTGALGGYAADRAIRGGLKGAQELTIPGTGMDSYAATRKLREESKNAAEAADKKDREEKMVRENAAALDKALKSGVTDDVKAALGNMSSDEIRDVVKKSPEKAQAIAQHMSAGEFNKMQNDLSLTQNLRDKMKAARVSKLQGDLSRARTNQQQLEKFAKDTDVDDFKLLVEEGKLDGAELERTARAMPTGKFKEFNDKKEINSALRKKVRTARYRNLNSLVETASTSTDPVARQAAVEAFQKEKPEDLDMAGILADANDPVRRARVVRLMSEDQYKKAKGFDLGTSTLSEIEKIRDDATHPESRFHPTHVADTFGHVLTKPKDRADIPAKALVEPHVYERLSAEDFAAIARKRKSGDKALDPAQRTTLSNHLQRIMAPSPTPPLTLEELALLGSIRAYMGSVPPGEWKQMKNYYGL